MGKPHFSLVTSAQNVAMIMGQVGGLTIHVLYILFNCTMLSPVFSVSKLLDFYF